MPGFKWFIHLSLHCFPILPGRSFAILDHFFTPILLTSPLSFLEFNTKEAHKHFGATSHATGHFKLQPNLDILVYMNKTTMLQYLGLIHRILQFQPRVLQKGSRVCNYEGHIFAIKSYYSMISN